VTPNAFSRYWTNEQCNNFIEVHTDPYSTATGLNATRSVYCDEINCVNFWNHTYNTFGIEAVTAEVLRGFRATFPSVTIPEPTGAAFKVWPNFVHWVAPSSPQVSNQQIDNWARNPIQGLNISLVGDAYHNERTPWIDGPLRASWHALNTQFGLTIPNECVNSTTYPCNCPVAGPPAYTLTSSASISIPSTGSSGYATPYPSTATMSSICPIATVTVTLTGVSHTYGSDMVVVLSHYGVNVPLMAYVGGWYSFSGVTLTFDDTAAAPLNDDPITSGTYKPSASLWCADYPSLCGTPEIPYSSMELELSAFRNWEAAGDWSLYVYDTYASADGGSITSFTVDVQCNKRVLLSF
jgi:hypothetical protein